MVRRDPAKFFVSDVDADTSYEAVRDADHLADAKAFIEKIWAIYAPHADPGFLEDVRWHFHQRTWEMYVWYVFHYHSLHPAKVSPAGPEFFIVINGRRFWVEAIAPGVGDTVDAVPLPAMRRIETVPEEKILLRFTHALDKKLKALMKGRESGLICPEDGYIIAINGWHATGYRPDTPFVPFAIKAALGIGAPYVSVDPEGRTPSRWSYSARDHVLKVNGAVVATTAFLSPEYAGVSALLYSNTDIVNIRCPIGTEMYYFHNPLARNKLPPGSFKFCREYSCNLGEGKLYAKDWGGEVSNPVN